MTTFQPSTTMTWVMGTKIAKVVFAFPRPAVLKHWSYYHLRSYVIMIGKSCACGHYNYSTMIWNQCKQVLAYKISSFLHIIPCLLYGSCEDLEQPAVWSHIGIIFVHVQAPAQDTTFYQKVSRQLPPHMTNHFLPVLRIPSFRLMLLSILAVILTLCHLNQFFDA